MWLALILAPAVVGGLIGRVLAGLTGGSEVISLWRGELAWGALAVGVVASGWVAWAFAERFGFEAARLQARIAGLALSRALEDQAPLAFEPLRGLAEETDRLAVALKEADSQHLQFMAMVSHEMRAPIASVLGFSSMLLEMPEGMNEDQQRFLEIIHRQSNKLAKLVDDLIVAGRLDANQLDYTFAPVRLSRVVQEVAGDLARAFPDRTVEVLDEAGTDTVLADSLRLKQLVTNLMQNALKFSPGGQAVTVRLRRAQDGTVMLDVIDRGVGLSPDELSQLFQRFGRVRNERTRNIPGSGLGLYISQRIAQAHGGRIEVDSAPGQGSRFSVRFQTHPPSADGAIA